MVLGLCRAATSHVVTPTEAPHVLQPEMILSFLPFATAADLPCATAIPALRCHQPPNPITDRKSHRSHPMINFVSFAMDFLLVFMSEEARIAKEVEAHEIRIRKELEKQDILRFGSDSIVNCLSEPIPRELLDLSLEVNLPHSRENVQHRAAFGEESLKLPVLDEGNHEQQEPDCEQQETREGVGGPNQELVVQGGAQKLRGDLDHVVIIGASKDGLSSVAKECHLISFVDGFFRSVVSDIRLTILAQGCRRLVRLELCGCEGSYDGIKAIGQCCQMLEELTLSDHKMDGG
nr:f-box protein [Quercus suber]